MEQSEWIKELTELGEGMDKSTKGEIFSIAVNLKGVKKYTSYVLCGLSEITDKIATLCTIYDLIGEDLFYKVQQIQGNDMDGEEEKQYIEKADILIAFAKLLKECDFYKWTPEIIKRFEDGLDSLRVSLNQESGTVDQGVS